MRNSDINSDIDNKINELLQQDIPMTLLGKKIKLLDTELEPHFEKCELGYKLPQATLVKLKSNQDGITAALKTEVGSIIDTHDDKESAKESIQAISGQICKDWLTLIGGLMTVGQVESSLIGKLKKQCSLIIHPDKNDDTRFEGIKQKYFTLIESAESFVIEPSPASATSTNNEDFHRQNAASAAPPRRNESSKDSCEGLISAVDDNEYIDDWLLNKVGRVIADNVFRSTYNLDQELVSTLFERLLLDYPKLFWDETTALVPHVTSDKQRMFPEVFAYATKPGENQIDDLKRIGWILAQFSSSQLETSGTEIISLALQNAIQNKNRAQLIIAKSVIEAIFTPALPRTRAQLEYLTVYDVFNQSPEKKWEAHIKWQNYYSIFFQKKTGGKTLAQLIRDNRDEFPAKNENRFFYMLDFLEFGFSKTETQIVKIQQYIQVAQDKGIDARTAFYATELVQHCFRAFREHGKDSDIPNDKKRTLPAELESAVMQQKWIDSFFRCQIRPTLLTTDDDPKLNEGELKTYLNELVSNKKITEHDLQILLTASGDYYCKKITAEVICTTSKTNKQNMLRKAIDCMYKSKTAGELHHRKKRFKALLQLIHPEQDISIKVLDDNYYSYACPTSWAWGHSEEWRQDTTSWNDYLKRTHVSIHSPLTDTAVSALTAECILAIPDAELRQEMSELKPEIVGGSKQESNTHNNHIVMSIAQHILISDESVKFTNFDKGIQQADMNAELETWATQLAQFAYTQDNDVKMRISGYLRSNASNAFYGAYFTEMMHGIDSAEEQATFMHQYLLKQSHDNTDHQFKKVTKFAITLKEPASQAKFMHTYVKLAYANNNDTLKEKEKVTAYAEDLEDPELQAKFMHKYLQLAHPQKTNTQHEKAIAFSKTIWGVKRQTFLQVYFDNQENSADKFLLKAASTQNIYALTKTNLEDAVSTAEGSNSTSNEDKTKLILQYYLMRSDNTRNYYSNPFVRCWLAMARCFTGKRSFSRDEKLTAAQSLLTGKTTEAGEAANTGLLGQINRLGGSDSEE